jgi:hypothetical protein
MTPSEDLFRLIKSLKKHEKRAFQLYTARYGKDTNYLKLFSAIDSQSEYDEEKIKKAFKGQALIDHLPSEKNYLFHLILDCLAELQRNTAGQQIQRKIEKARLLHQRGLTAAALKLLKSCRKEAHNQEQYGLMLQIISLEKDIASANYFTGKSTVELQALYEEEQHYLRLLENANDYWILFSRFYRFHYSRGSVRDEKAWSEIVKIMEHPLLQDSSRAASFQTQQDFYRIYALFHFMQDEPAKALEYNKAYLQLLESRPDKLKEYSRRYLATLNNYLMDCLGMRKLEEVRAGISRMKDLPQTAEGFTTEQMQADIFRLSAMLELNYYIRCGQFEAGSKTADAILKTVDTGEYTIVKHNLLTLFYLSAYNYFGAGDYRKALRCLNRIMQEAEEQVLEDIQAFARIFSIIVHFELDNFDVIEHLQTATQRFLQNRNKFYRTESVIVSGLGKFNAVMSAKDKLNQFRKLKSAIDSLKEDAAEVKALGYFDFDSWLTAKIEGRSFREVMNT